MLHEIEIESEYYGLRLNRGKCELIEMNGTEQICFKNGEDMSKVQQAKYLGGILTKKADAKTEIQARITATNPVIRSLDVLWKQTKCSIKWKLLIFNAVCISKLAYGLETLIATEATLHKLNTVQMKGLRKILKIPVFH